MKYKVMDEKGRSMIEMLGVLAIVGVLSVAGIAGYSKAMAKYKINKLMDQVSTIAANTKTLFAAVGSYKGLAGEETTAEKINERAYKLGLFPDDMVKACSKSNPKFASATASGVTTPGCVVNGMNGGVELSATAGDFTIKFTGLTKDACTALVASDWGGAAGFKSIKGVAETPYTPATLASTGVYAAAKAACTSASTIGDKEYEITWTFY